MVCGARNLHVQCAMCIPSGALSLIFSVPATTAGVERLFSIAGYILSCRRLSLIDRNFEDQVFAHCNSDLLANASRKRKPDAD